MKRMPRLKPIVCFVMIFAFVCASLSNIMMKTALAAPDTGELSGGYLNVTEKYLNFNSKDTTYNFDIKKEAQQKGASYTWYVKTDKGEPGAISIDSRTGVVTAKKAGTAYIRCKITYTSGKVVRPEAKVVVRNNITEVDISNIPKEQTILLGEVMDFDRVILNTDAGKGKGTKGITRWEIDNNTAGVKEIKDNGVVKPTSAGSFAIRAVCFQSKDKYKLWLKDKDKNSSYITAASKWYKISVVSSIEEAKAATQEELELALTDSKIKKITISTDKEIKFTIAKGSYTDKTIVIDAPNAEIDNYGSFQKIIILAIKDNTWNENAEGNSFHVSSVKVRIIINGNAEVREIVFDRANSVINVEVQGKVHQITLLQPSEISLTGNGDQVPITIEETAEGSKLTTSIPLSIEAHNDSEIIINPGAEGTRINRGAVWDTVSVVNNSSASVGITTENAEEEQVEAGKSVVVGGTPAPAPGSPSGPIAPTITSITIKTPATKTVYKVGDTLDITGLSIEGSYSDGSRKSETITSANISGFNSMVVTASQTLTVNVGGKTVTYTISIIKADAPALVGVSMDDAENTLIGMAPWMEFSIDGGATWTAYNAVTTNLPDLTGTITIQVRFAETTTHNVGEAMTFSFHAGELLGLTIKTPANKLVYKVGEVLDITGLVIEGTYSDGGRRIVPVTTGNINGFNSSTVHESQILIVNIGPVPVIYTISIVKADGLFLSGVSRNDALNTLAGMAAGMEFSIDGGTTWTAYNATTPNLPDLTGTITIQVRYAATATHNAGEAMTFQFTLGVLESITVNASGATTVYMVGESLDISGLVVEGHYSDGGIKTETITLFDIDGFDSSAVTASQTLSVTVGGKSATYTIEIIKAIGQLLIGVGSYDALNTMVGMTTGMEFSIDGGTTWTAYNATTPNLPDLTGTITILVRYAETATHVAGPYVPFTFTAGELVSIAIKTPANKLVYNVGEPLDITGLVVEGTYSDGGKRPVVIITTNITGFNSGAVAASQILTVKVGEKTATYTISIIKADGSAVTCISVDDAENTLTGMAAGMEFSIDGGVTWTEYDAATPNLPDLSGTITIQVRYKETATHNAGEAEYFYFTAGELLSIAIKAPANKLVYIVGQELDITGLVVEGTYSDGGKRTVAITPANISGFNSSVAAESQALTIDVEEKTVTYTIKINPPEDISSITVIIPTPYPFDFAVSAAGVEAATEDPDFTVTSISWNSLTAYGSYPEWALVTAEVVLTSKNYKQFKAASYTPVVEGAYSVSSTITSGSGTGNTARYTVQFLVDYMILYVADKYGYVTGGSGTIDDPKTYTVSVGYNSDSLTLGDIQTTPNASVRLYTNPDFSTGEITGANTVPLLVGNNVVYIKAITPDTTRYYIINIKRVNGDNNIKSIFGKTDTSPTGVGTSTSPCAWQITVENDITVLNASNIELPDFSKVWYYSDASFIGMYNISLPFSLSVGTNEIYIVIQAEDYEYKFHKVTIYRLPPKEIVAVAAIDDITVVYGTEESEIGLPDTVLVTFDDSSSSSFSVSWDAGTPPYNGNAAGTYMFEGTLALPAGVTNSSALMASVKVIVEEKVLGKEPLTAAINNEYADGAIRTELKLTQADYTAESWTAYTNAISAAITLEEAEEVTQEQIDEVISMIVTMKAALVFDGMASLDAVKAEAASLTEADYSSDNWELLAAALDLPESTNSEVVYKTTQIYSALTILAIELIDQAITNAKALIPAALTMEEGTDTNLLDKLNAISGIGTYGVTLSIGSSDNVNISNDGGITYSGTEVTDNVIIKINKTGGTEQSISISITVPKQLTYSIHFFSALPATEDFGNLISTYDPNSVSRGNYIIKDDESGTITNLQITFEGMNPTAFTYTPDGIWRTTLTNEEYYNHFWYHPVGGLAQGSYTATMIISADHGIRYEVLLKFRVS